MTRQELAFVEAVAEVRAACLLGVWPEPSGILSFEESVALADLQILDWPAERIRELREVGRTYGGFLARVRADREATSC